MKRSIRRIAALLCLFCLLLSAQLAAAEQIPWNLTLVNSTHAVPED